MENDYRAFLTQALVEFGVLFREREEIDLKFAQKLQLIRAAMNQLPEDEVGAFEEELQRIVAGGAGLSDSVRTALSKHRKKFMTATEVRDEMKKAGFDFGNYSSNPLASIHSVLKRLKPDEVDNQVVAGVMAWRWKKSDKPRVRRLRRNAAFYGEGSVGNLGALRDMLLNPLTPREKK